MSTEIKQIETLISGLLDNGQKFVSCECKKLLSSGENYGSTMLLALIKLINKNGEEEVVQCVGKTGPPSDFLWEFFNTKDTFKKEISVYSVIVPELNNYGREKGIDCLLTSFAKCIGARISLDPKAKEVDEDAVLLLENLKIQGYDVLDRCVGFDETVSKILLNDLAVLHAAVIGYRLEKPEEFKTKIFPHLHRYYVFDPSDEFVDDIIKSTQNAAAKNPKCIPYLSKIDKAFRDIRYYLDNPPKGKEIFTTITHNDYWVNNIMLKYENRAIKSKMLDFQIMEYSSLAHDVIFFLYSSVELSVLENKIDELIRHYYDRFIAALITLKCDVNDYSFESMMDEFALIAKGAQFSHILYMLRPILTSKQEAKDLSEFDYSGFIIVEGTMHENYYKRLAFFLLDFVRRGWI